MKSKKETRKGNVVVRQEREEGLREKAAPQDPTRFIDQTRVDSFQPVWTPFSPISPLALHPCPNRPVLQIRTKERVNNAQLTKCTGGASDSEFRMLLASGG